MREKNKPKPWTGEVSDLDRYYARIDPRQLRLPFTALSMHPQVRPEAENEDFIIEHHQERESDLVAFGEPR